MPFAHTAHFLLVGSLTVAIGTAAVTAVETGSGEAETADIRAEDSSSTDDAKPVSLPVRLVGGRSSLEGRVEVNQT